MTSARQTRDVHAAKPPPDDLRPPPTFAGSAMADAARRAVDHFGAKDAPDPVELWGRRIGRALSLAACIGLGVYLYLTYLR
jgi:hypothetical protein